ncbi:hypothetical protein E3T35_17115 [Cryobacterium sp. TMT1-2-2]|uniref:hypothetical protein n=1 Tax=Cryobacterium sp. TMT1-2-2 TaxID=1259233 RepID=UPI00106DA9D7|nr:hypothetical protein [Cryobacterium sp. TMT1-2-2]TFD08401.1 hypothetical protein E3T35_17115 [Cryobacterium sp. TMT1-2-2]
MTRSIAQWCNASARTNTTQFASGRFPSGRRPDAVNWQYHRRNRFRRRAYGCPLTIRNVAQSLVYTTTLGKGTLTLAPTFALSVPANTFRSNYSDAVGSTAVDPCVSTITFTIA